MRHEYVGDIGDFGKYALLKALAGNDLTLGVVWYLNVAHESNNDGQFTSYDHLRICDPTLHDKLRAIVQNGKRSLRSVEAASVLPDDTIFYSNPTPIPAPSVGSVTRTSQCALRESWHADAIQVLSKANLVFLDPDNGLAGENVERHSRRSAKYVFREEVSDWLSRGKSVVLYQHQQRRTLRELVRSQLVELGQRGWALTFHRLSVRIYYILPASEEHEELLAHRTRVFLESEWGRKEHFRLNAL